MINVILSLISALFLVAGTIQLIVGARQKNVKIGIPSYIFTIVLYTIALYLVKFQVII